MCLTIPAKVVSVKENKALVDFIGRKQEVDARLVKVRIGDYVMVSNGFAIKKVGKKEAKEILKIINKEA